MQYSWQAIERCPVLPALILRVHLGASLGAVSVIVMFLASSAITDLTGNAGEIRVVRHAIVYALPLLAACLASAGLTGYRLAGGSSSPVLRRKQRRLKAAAAIGLAVLVPCALILNDLTTSVTSGAAVGALEVTEMVFGALNLCLLSLNLFDGLRITHRTPAKLVQGSDVRP